MSSAGTTSASTTAASTSAAAAGSSSSSSTAVASSSSSSAAISSSSAITSSTTAGSSSTTTTVSSAAAAASSAIPSTTGSDSSATASSSTLSGGAIGGIVGGIVGGLALLAFAYLGWKWWSGKRERERYPLPPPRSMMAQRPGSMAGSAMLGEPRRMSSGNLLMASSPSNTSFARHGRRDSAYSFGPPLMPPRRPYSSSTTSSSQHGGLGGAGGPSYGSSSSAASSSPPRASLDHSTVNAAGQAPSSGSSAPNSPEITPADGFAAGPSAIFPTAESATGFSTENSHDSPPSRAGSTSSRSSTSRDLPPPPVPSGNSSGGMSASPTARQLRISTSSLGPHRREASRYSMSSVSSSRSLHPPAGGSIGGKATGTPHGGRRIDLTLPAPLAAPTSTDSWTMYGGSTGGGRPSRMNEQWSAAELDEHGRLDYRGRQQ